MPAGASPRMKSPWAWIFLRSDWWCPIPRKRRPLIRWMRLALAGLCVGVNVMDGADIGALYSIVIAAFVFFKAVFAEEGTVVKKLAHGIGGVAIVALFAGFIALQTVMGLIGTEVNGIAGTGQNAETKAQHWDWATQWSEPKIETLGLLVPGLFGYKMNTPNNMMPALQDAYRGGVYWGGMGRDPAIDRFFDSGATTGAPPPAVLCVSREAVAIIAAFWWCSSRHGRLPNRSAGKTRPSAASKRNSSGFGRLVLFISLLLAWGRFAPFNCHYFMSGSATHAGFFHVSEIRPSFFLSCLGQSVILFAYGVHGLSRRCLEIPAVNSNSLSSRLTNWWAKAANFDRKWTYWPASGIFGASVLGWFIYASQKTCAGALLADARIFRRRLRQADNHVQHRSGWLVAGDFCGGSGITDFDPRRLFCRSACQISRTFIGRIFGPGFGPGKSALHHPLGLQTKIRGRVAQPHRAISADKPYEHRVAKLLPAPLSTPSQFQLFDQLYSIEWTQHHFLYYNIQCLDIIQMPRMPEDLESLFETPCASGSNRMRLGYTCLMKQLSQNSPDNGNFQTRVICLAPPGSLMCSTQQLDPGQHRFHIAQRFDVLPKPGITSAYTSSKNYTAVLPPMKMARTRSLNSPAHCPAPNCIPTGRSTPTIRPI